MPGMDFGQQRDRARCADGPASDNRICKRYGGAVRVQKVICTGLGWRGFTAVIGDGFSGALVMKKQEGAAADS